MKLHYFNQFAADNDDLLLAEAIRQAKVPPTCLLGGAAIMTYISAGKKPCDGCNGPRNKCYGPPKGDDITQGTAAELTKLYNLITGDAEPIHEQRLRNR